MLIPKGKALFQNDEGKVFRQRKWQNPRLPRGWVPCPGKLPGRRHPFHFGNTLLRGRRHRPKRIGRVRHYSTKHPVIREITCNLRTSHRALRPVIKAEPARENSEAEALLAKVVAKYRHTSLAEKLTKDPPVRGTHGMADIQLVLGARPRIQRPYHVVREREAAIHELVEEFIARGWLEPSTANWSSPGFVVPKPRPNEWRMVVDYRWLNEFAVPDAYPLPLIEDILCRQGKNKVWTVLDMKHGYHQMPLSPESHPLTTMAIPEKGLYQWKVMPMRVCNGNTQFQRMMEWVLKDLPYADVYVDDFIIGSTGETE